MAERGRPESGSLMRTYTNWTTAAAALVRVSADMDKAGVLITNHVFDGRMLISTVNIHEDVSRLALD